LGKFLRLFILILLVVGVAFYFAFNMIMGVLVRSKKETVVPNVVGRDLYKALEELSSVGCGLKKESEEFNQNVPEGIIFRQDPSAGMNVKEGKVVKVSISKGGEMVYVPNLIGQTIRFADISLKNSALILGEISKKYSTAVGKGIVISQDVESGSAIDKYSVVNIVVSNGSPPKGVLFMPNFLGKNIGEARVWALQRGISVNIANDDTSKTNIIVKQSPESDEDITRLKSVDLWLG
jgi:serine/threonine-protein kinase